MPKSNLADAARTMIHYLEVSYNRQGTGPKLEPEMVRELAEVVRSFEFVDDMLNRAAMFPPIDKAELENCKGFTGVYDRIVIALNGVYGRRPATGGWDRLRSLAEQERIDAAELAKKEAARAAAVAEALAKTPIDPQS